MDKKKDTPKDNRVLFALSRSGQGDGSPIVLLGVSNEAWNYMADGKTHTFDLTSIGLSIKIVLFGAPTRDAALEMITGHLKKGGIEDIIDASDQDFSIKPKGE